MLYRWIAGACVLVAAAGCGGTDEQPEQSPSPSASALPVAPNGPAAGVVAVGSYGDSPAGSLIAGAYTAALNSAGIPADVVPQTDTAAALAALAADRVDVVGVPLGEAAAAEGIPLAAGTSTDSALDALRDSVESSGATLLDPAAAVDGPTFAVRAVYARRNAVATLSDLARQSVALPVVLAGPLGCRSDPLCRPALVLGYGAAIGAPVSTPEQRVPQRVAARGATVGAIRSSDSSLDRLRLRVLEDDRAVLPPATIVAVAGPQAGEDVRRVVERVNERLTTDALRQMDAAVAAGADPMAAADAWVTTNLSE